MLDRNTLCICLTVFGVVTSVAWAIAFTNIYAPIKDAKQLCAENHAKYMNSPFCLATVRADR